MYQSTLLINNHLLLYIWKCKLLVRSIVTWSSTWPQTQGDSDQYYSQPIPSFVWRLIFCTYGGTLVKLYSISRKTIANITRGIFSGSESGSMYRYNQQYGSFGGNLLSTSKATDGNCFIMNVNQKDCKRSSLGFNQSRSRLSSRTIVKNTRKRKHVHIWHINVNNDFQWPADFHTIAWTLPNEFDTNYFTK